MKITEQLNILGVTMARSTQTTRSLNGEELVSRIRKTTNSFKSGRFMPVSTRPWVSSVFLMSRINYRTCALNLRQQDIQRISSAVKSWVMQGFLIRPPENILFRNTAEGGLGLVNTAARARANLIKTFIHKRNHHPNIKTVFSQHYSGLTFQRNSLPTPFEFLPTTAASSSRSSGRSGRSKRATSST